MRDLLARLSARLLTKPRDKEALARARREAAQAKTQAASDAALIRDAHDVAARLAQHRSRNHFAERMHAAFEEDR